LVGATITKVEDAHADESIARIHLTRDGKESSFVLFATELGFWMGQDKIGDNPASLQALIDAMAEHDYQKHYLDEPDTPYISVNVGIGDEHIGFRCTKCNELFKITKATLLKSKFGKYLDTIEKREEFAKLLPYPPIIGLAPLDFPIVRPIKGINSSNFIKKIKEYNEECIKAKAEQDEIERRIKNLGSVEAMFDNIFAHNGPSDRSEDIGKCVTATYLCCDSALKRTVGFACENCGKEFTVGLSEVRKSPIAKFFNNIMDRAKIAKMLPLIYCPEFEKELKKDKSFKANQ
jgi:hypothetical protein